MLKEKTSDVSMTNTNQGSGTAAEAAVPMSHGLWNTWRKNLLLFCLTGVYVELCLHLCVFGSMDRYAGYPVLFGLLGGALCTLVVSSLPKVLRQITGVFLVAAQVLLAEVQLVYHCIFGDFMPVSQIGMGGNVVVNFNSQLLYGIRQNLLKILLLLLPLIAVILCLALRRVQALRFRLRWKQAMASFAVLLALLLTVTGLMYVGRDNAFSVYRTFTNVNTSTDSSYKKIGMLATTAQELRYMLFSGSGSIMITPSSLNISDVPRTYSSNSYNVIESIDFTALADSTDSDILKATDEYLSNATPTRKNNYTGLLKDYNLITICAESFCPWFISEELTPTLYKLSHTGILFENYYGTFQSVTTNGEYTMCMGLYPDMSRTKTDSSFNVAGTNYLPFCLGNALKGMGYQAWGYHDYIGDFYNRNITHANMGYTFKAADSGLDVKIDWPSSDLEMMEASVDDYINSGEPFHAYYMTFSGHYQYNWDNAMSAKNRDAVCNLPYSETVQAYLACNMELEYALEDLFEQLERAGQTDNTVIVLTADHYPYGLSESQYNELAGKDIDTTFEKYHNSFLCYIPNMQPVDVDTYCCDIDILPTLLNLFGVSYDSRLLAGKDILSDSTHVAVLADQSYLTDSFCYNAETGTAQSYDTRPVKDADVQAYCQYVSNIFSFSTQVLNNDYYAHVFGKSAAKQTQTYDFSDITNPFEEASALFAVENGYMLAKSRTEFGAQTSATYGEVLRALYRMAGGTQSLSDAAVITWAQEHALISDDVSAQDTMTYGSVSRLFLRYLADRKIDVSLTETDKTQLAQIQAGYTELDDTTCLAMYWMRKHAILQDNDLGQYYSLADQILNRAQVSRCLQGISSLVQPTF